MGNDADHNGKYGEKVCGSRNSCILYVFYVCIKNKVLGFTIKYLQANIYFYRCQFATSLLNVYAIDLLFHTHSIYER